MGVKERPILFSGPMVRAIIAGTKTQTRRAVKPQPTRRLIEGLAHVTIGMNPADDGAVWYDGDCKGPGREVRCPYGGCLDRLWVRECWARYHTVNHVVRQHGGAISEVSDGLAAYRADGHETIDDLRTHIRLTSGCDLEAIEVYGNRWRPSIHMPRWASRITLEITGVRVERLQDISEADAKAEGVTIDGIGNPGGPMRVHQRAFKSLWQSINGPGSWDANPWVWCIEFRKI